MRHPAGLPADLAVLDRTLVMGILNVTPDSFSDGGLYFDHDAAVAHGLAMAEAGADLVDVGGESTRPGAVPVPSREERRRVVEVVRALASEGVYVSIDTRHADVAEDCVVAGAVLVNDVSAGRGDGAMWPFIAETGVPYVLMHNRGDGVARPDLSDYSEYRATWSSYEEAKANGFVDPPAWHASTGVWRELDQRLLDAERAGVREDRVVVDPGIGFAKDAPMNWALVDDEALAAMADCFWSPLRTQGLGEYIKGRPALLGVSRKRFLATHPDGTPRDDDSMEQRDRVTLEITERAARHGVWCVRVHDVAPNAEAVRRVGATARMES
jgi:dihydropteroate synthase